ncbi:MAG: hypothetical protein GY923_15375 [Aestuariibacter sp.]|nr:hypothetical protein [Aestuariibacter sp.]
MKHTPGPWRFDDDYHPCVGTDEGENSREIADVRDVYPNYDDSERVANARLIAQAPRMYELLLEIQAVEDISHDGQEAIAAVLKAVGTEP